MNQSLFPMPPPPIGEDRKHFDVIAKIALRDAGLVIAPEKAPMVFARLAKRLRALGLSRRGEYCTLLCSQEGAPERRRLISALTTNVTGYFREAHHFDLLSEILQSTIIRRARSGEKIRMWSAGCSNGSEPYSMAMQVLDAYPDAANSDIRILATDIDPEVLAVGRLGIYEEDRFSALPDGFRERFTRNLPQDSAMSPLREVSRELKRLVSFRELNLLAEWPMRRKFDIIFCRNVVIYFDRQTQDTLWPRFETACKPGGYLCLGHSERLSPHQHGSFQPVGRTSYRRRTEPLR